MLKKLSLDATFKSMGPESEDPTAPLIIEGYASTRDLDRSCDVILPSAWTTSGGLKNFSSNPILLFNHDYDKPIGKVLDMAVDDRGLRVRGSISPSVEKIYNLVKEGILTTFSVGFCVRDAEYDDMADGLVIKDAELLEISVVSIPCNQDATFSVAKSFDSQNDYLAFRKQFESGKPLTADTVVSQEKKKMDENEIQLAVEKAFAAKQAAEAKAAAEAAEKAAAAEALAVKAGQTASEKLYAELEKRFAERDGQNVDIAKELADLKADLAEKSAELQAIAKSKRNFQDRNGSNADWQKQFAKEADDAYLLGRLTGKGYETEYAKQLLEKVNSFSSVRVSSDNFEREVSMQIERDIQEELILAPLFQELNMTAASLVVPIAPDANYASISGVRNLPGTAPNGLLDSRGTAVGTGAGIALTEVEFRTLKLVAKTYLNNDTEEDVLLPILPMLRDGMIRQHARGVEQLILRAGETGSVYAAASATTAVGLTKYASTQSRTVTAAGAATPLTAAALLGLRKQMGKYGSKASDIVYIVSRQCYFELLEDAEFQDFNLVNTVATKLTGEVGQVFGTPVIVCDEFAAAATGQYHALAVNVRNFKIPRQRGLTVESQYLVEEQHKVLATTQRLGFKELIPDAKAVIGLKYA